MISIHKIFLLFIIFLTFLTSCQLRKSTNSHGILFLENRLNTLKVNTTNTNDAIRIIGVPHAKSIDNSKDIWIYIERVTGKGKYHKLGKPILLKNNVAVLEFDKYGVLKDKKIYNKDDINKMKFSDKNTENIMSKKSFVDKFLSSVKSKMYGNK